MSEDHPLALVNPPGDQPLVEPAVTGPIPVDTYAGRIDVEWDPDAAVTPLGQMPFFIEFLKQAGLFDGWVAGCPLHYTSRNAPLKRDVLGTLLLSVLSGHRRYAHITTLRADTVNPQRLGMTRILSEDAVRRGLERIDLAKGATWLQADLDYAVRPLLREPWILDVDTTVKPLSGPEALPVGGSLRGAGVQLVEPVRTACRSGSSPRGDHQPALVADRDWAADNPCRPPDASRQQRARTALVDAPRADTHWRLLRRPASNCGAVDAAGSMVSHPQYGPREIPRRPTVRTAAPHSGRGGYSHRLNSR
jgi:hypothetical protein